MNDDLKELDEVWPVNENTEYILSDIVKEQEAKLHKACHDFKFWAYDRILKKLS